MKNISKDNLEGLSLVCALTTWIVSSVLIWVCAVNLEFNLIVSTVIGVIVTIIGMTVSIKMLSKAYKE